MNTVFFLAYNLDVLLTMCSISINIVFILSVLLSEGVIALSLQNFIKKTLYTQHLLRFIQEFLKTVHACLSSNGGSYIVSPI